MPLDRDRIRALCFDVDGTLSDTDDQFVCKVGGWLRPVCFLFSGRDPLPPARRLVMMTESPGNALYGLADRLGIDDPLANLGEWVYRRGLMGCTAPFLLVPGVREMLEKLQSHFPMSVVSARGRRSTFLFLDQFALTPFFQSVATAQTCRHTKPYPDPIRWAARQMGVAPEDCLMVGDTTVDMRAGKAAGAQTVGVLCGFGDENELRRSGADLILPSTAALAQALLEN